MNKKRSLTVVMPALNEERHLEEAVASARARIEPYFAEWEILIFNDGSSDRTGEIADRLAASESRILAFHHATPKNLGGVYREGVIRATKEFIIMIPGDNENGGESLDDVLDLAGTADIIIPYVKNPSVRVFTRRVISRTFVILVNLLSGCRIRYYNGTVLHRSEILKKHGFKTDGFGYQAEILVDLIRRGYTYSQVGIELTPKPAGTTSAFRLANIVKVAKFMITLRTRTSPR